MKKKVAIVIPMANESDSFQMFIGALTKTLDEMSQCDFNVFMVVDRVSKDNTLELCTDLSNHDDRFKTVWAPENRNVVDAYIRGYKEALASNVDYIIEMDAGMSHDPAAIPQFVRCLSEGHRCAFGSRFINGGSIYDSNWRRSFLSKGGTILANILLGTSMKDMTSGYMGFHREQAQKFVDYQLRSKAHFYQTEVRYLMRKERYIEVPIHYIAPSPRVSQKAIINSFSVLFYYFLMRITNRNVRL